MRVQIEKPKYRSHLRLLLGSRYYMLRRYCAWAFSDIRFAKPAPRSLDSTIFTHATPLIRDLRGADIQLQHNKITNLKIAAGTINGTIINPGETFSYWKSIGKPTKQKGYLEGIVLKNGKCVAGVGGGLCQLSNLLYWMALHSPLRVTERHRHSYDVFPDSNRSQPFGSGATCFYNYGDLMIRNETDAAYQLSVRVTEDSLTGELRSNRPSECTYEIYEREHYMKAEFWGGYSRHNLIFRKKYAHDGEQISDEYITENHALMMYEPLLEG